LPLDPVIDTELAAAFCFAILSANKDEIWSFDDVVTFTDERPRPRFIASILILELLFAVLSWNAFIRSFSDNGFEGFGLSELFGVGRSDKLGERETDPDSCLFLKF